MISPNPNTRPIVNSNMPPTGAVSINEASNQVFQVWASDPEGSNLTYTWTWDGETVGANTNSYTRTTAWGDSGLHSLRCIVSDGLWTNHIFAEWPVTIMDIPLQITTAEMPSGMELFPYQAVLAATNGIPPYVWKFHAGAVAWGNNSYGQADVPDGVGVSVAVAAGVEHSILLSKDGTVTAWGRNDNGQASVPSGLNSVVAVAAGGWHNLALKVNGAVVAWGSNASGQTNVPVGLMNVVGIAAGSSHSLALMSNGRVLAWGDNSSGQTNVPAGLSNVTMIAGGWAHSLALKSNGTVAAWGASSYGRIAVPADLTNAIAIAAGGEHSVALKSDGTVVAWGRNNNGQTNVPVGLSNVVAIAAGSDHTLALKSDRQVVAWGHNGNGQSTIPPGVSNVTAIAGGWRHSIVAKSSAATMSQGLTCSTDGVVYGTPAQAGTNVVNFVVQDNVGTITNKALEIVIAPHPNGRPTISSNSPPSGAFGMNEASSQIFQTWAYDPEGSNLVYAWTWDGEAVGSNSNLYSRTADWGDSGLHTLQCTVADEFWTNSVFVQWDVAIADIPMQITTTNMPGGTEMAPYSAQLQATNGPGPYMWSFGGDTPLPDGLSCSSSGLVSGTPTIAGTNVVTFVVWDDFGVAIKDLSIVIAPNPNTRPVLFSKTPATNSVSLQETSNATFSVLGYDPEGADLSYAWTWDGVAVGSNSNRHAQTAAWGSAGWRVLRCYLSDGLWTNAVYAEWSVFVELMPRVILTESLPGGMEMVAYNAWLSATNGAAPFSWSVWSGTPLPPGLSCATDGHVSGYPTQAGTYGVNFVARDSVGVRTNKTLTINIESNANTRPVIFGRAPDTNAVAMNESTSQLFRVYAYDPEGIDPLSYVWTWDGVAVGGNGSTYSHATAWGDAGRHTLRGYASDDLWTNVVYAQWTVLVKDDNDGDGMSNGQELDLQRNPNDPSDAGAGASLSGTILGGGIGIAGALVELRGAGGTVYHRAFSDATGAYAVGAIPPGLYFVKACAEDFADEWYDNTTSRTNALAFAVVAGSTNSGFNFDLASGQSPALVEVTSDPSGASIYVDFQPIPQVTPAVVDVGEVASHAMGLFGGIASHVITVKSAGRPRPVPQAVAVAEAETVSAHFDLTSSEAGSVSIATTPDGADVYVDYADVPEGVSPAVVGNMAPGSHVILLKKAGCLQPRPVVVRVEANSTTDVDVPLASDGEINRIVINAQSVPTNARIYIDYLPTVQVTDAVVDWMDPASHSGSGWHSATHTIMLRRPGSMPTAPRYVPDATNGVQSVQIQLIEDVVAAVDEDGDGMPDQLEEPYEDLPGWGAQGADDDYDGDGVSNIGEMISGTHAGDSDSVFEISDGDLSSPGNNDTFTLTFHSVPGHRYVIRGKASMGNNAEWIVLSPALLATGYQTTYAVTLPENIRFFQLVVLNP